MLIRFAQAHVGSGTAKQSVETIYLDSHSHILQKLPELGLTLVQP